jgi:nickel-dependent lactate racemase
VTAAASVEKPSVVLAMSMMSPGVAAASEEAIASSDAAMVGDADAAVLSEELLQPARASPAARASAAIGSTFIVNLLFK